MRILIVYNIKALRLDWQIKSEILNIRFIFILESYIIR